MVGLSVLTLCNDFVVRAMVGLSVLTLCNDWAQCLDLNATCVQDERSAMPLLLMPEELVDIFVTLYEECRMLSRGRRGVLKNIESFMAKCRELLSQNGQWHEIVPLFCSANRLAPENCPHDVEHAHQIFIM